MNYAVDCRNGTINDKTNGTLQAKSTGGIGVNFQNVVMTCEEREREMADTYQDTCGPLMANSHPGSYSGQDAYTDMFVTGSVVRRLTPTECERLQGFPDDYTDIGAWTDSKGKLHKESSDSSRYKALGNSIATGPNSFWKFLLKRIAAEYDRECTLGSLFDGIGGFPLIHEQINGKGTARWASEIEEFCIAVTKRRFGEE